MTYEIFTEEQEHIVNILVEIKGEAGELVLEGRTKVSIYEPADGKTREQEAREYAEQVFIPDLQKNTRALKGVMLSAAN